MADRYEMKRLEGYEPASRGEKIAYNNLFLRVSREYNWIKVAVKKPQNIEIITEYLNDVSKAIEDVWFNFLDSPSENIDLTILKDVVNKWWNEHPIVEKFNTSVSKEYLPYQGGYADIYAIYDSLEKMASNRQKHDYESSGKKDNDFRAWEASVDKILNEDGVPSLNAFLEKWIDEVTESTYDLYSDSANIKKWVEDADKFSNEEKSSWKTITEFRYEWRNDPEKKKVYETARTAHELAKASYDNVMEKLKTSERILKAGKEGLKKYFEGRAREIKVDFVTKVCALTGPITSGSFEWGAGGRLNGYVNSNTGRYHVLSFFAGGPVQKLHVRTRITKLKDRGNQIN